MYEKTVWETGDIITASKLNNIENGIANLNGNGFCPILQIQGDYDIGDTIYNWNIISNYVYNDDGTALLLLYHSSSVYIYLIHPTFGNICLNSDDYTPQIYINSSGTIEEDIS